MPNQSQDHTTTAKQKNKQPKKLIDICETKVVQLIQSNPLLATNTICNNIPYHLLYSILRQINSYQLIADLETQNPHLLSLTEDIWERLLEKDFPNHVHVSFSKYKKIIVSKMFPGSQQQYDFPIEYDEKKQMFKIPSKLLYLKYKKELLLKENEAKLNLIKMNEKLQKFENSKSVVFLESDDDLNAILKKTVNKRESLLTSLNNKYENSGSFRNNSTASSKRSKLFVKSMNQHKDHHMRVFTERDRKNNFLTIPKTRKNENHDTDNKLKRLKVTLQQKDSKSPPTPSTKSFLFSSNASSTPNDHPSPNATTKDTKIELQKYLSTTNTPTREFSPLKEESFPERANQSKPSTIATCIKKKSSIFNNGNGNGNGNKQINRRRASTHTGVYIHDKTQSQSPRTSSNLSKQ